MLLTVKIPELSIGQNQLFAGVTLAIQEREKVALIGRNGAGKTTLFRLLAGEVDFDGEVIKKKGLKIAFTLQEHHAVQDVHVVDYILDAVPDYNRLIAIVSVDPATIANDLVAMQKYSTASRECAARGYFKLKKQVIEQLEAYQIPESRCQDPLATLSGGEKRYVELVKVMFSQADLLCMDEPTNHMDYYGKQVFIDWLRSTRQAVFIITHDRDVLQVVDRIVELKDKQLESSDGNYTAYLKRNGDTVMTRITQYEKSLRQLEILQKELEQARAKKAVSPQAKQKEERLLKEYETVRAQIDKPSFWIDDESGAQLDAKSQEKYARYKDATIRIAANGEQSKFRDLLLAVSDLSLGYDHPLFSGLSFSVYNNSRILLKGRNGAGKTSFIKTILARYAGVKPVTTLYAGSITLDEKVTIGVYEQEIDAAYMDMTVGEAITAVYARKGVYLTDQQLYQVMSSYLFDPTHDSALKFGSLSGGEKARLQIMGMFADTPDLLILDEPTNHLDLPSIEELERALATFGGAILYVSHDSYFNAKIAERTIEIHPER